MAYSFRHTNPELAGVLVKEAVRCGKQNCRCMRENQFHGGYWYLYFRDYTRGGILRKRYVAQAKVRQVKQRIASAKAEDMEEKNQLRSYLKLSKQLT